MVDLVSYDTAMTTTLRFAATALPLRWSDDGLEVLMIQRHPDLSFGGMWTFPGGAIEPVDGPEPPAVDDEERYDWRAPGLVATAAAAAVRETAEETSLRCNPAAMAWFSHWIPPTHGAPKRFATWFFLAPETSGDLALDLRENVDARWVSPAAALQEAASGDFPLSVPTWVTLDDLQDVGSVAALIDATVTAGPRIHHTVAAPLDGHRVLMWLGDDGYTSADPTAGSRRNRAVVNERLVVLRRERS